MKQREEKKEEGKVIIIITDYNEYIYINIYINIYIIYIFKLSTQLNHNKFSNNNFINNTFNVHRN